MNDGRQIGSVQKTYHCEISKKNKIIIVKKKNRKYIFYYYLLYFNHSVYGWLQFFDKNKQVVITRRNSLVRLLVCTYV